MTRHGALYQDIVPFTSRYFDKGKFGRLFPSLPPFSEDNARVREALKDIGKKGGIMDAQDDMTKSPMELITDAGLQVNNPNSPTISAGMTFLGQFIDHDVTFDPTSSLERQVDPEFIENFRTPTLALDNVYGSGPGASPHLYAASDGQGIKFLLEPLQVKGKDNIDKYDLPRNTQNCALIGDPRNDENLIVSQLHVLFLRFHNAIVDAVKAKYPSRSGSEIFREAQELVRWHYQWILLHEFLPLLCGEEVIDDVLKNGRKFYDWNNSPFIPVEFSVAAYRYGHSQVRPSYRANFGISNQENPTPFFAAIFDFNADRLSADPNDLRGGKRAPRRFVDWQTFFDHRDGSVRTNKLIDTKLSSPLFQLLGFGQGDVISLASRNLLRQLTFSLPSGQRIAHAMRLTPLESEVFDDLKHYKVNFENSTPPWFYILKEAEVQQMGIRLGEVGARIISEVFVGLLEGDKSSFLSQNPFWKPNLPCCEPYRNNKHFTIVDLARIAEGKVAVNL